MDVARSADTGSVWDVVKETALRASAEEPFWTYFSALGAAVIVFVAPIWIRCHYNYLTERARQNGSYGATRRKPDADTE